MARDEPYDPDAAFRAFEAATNEKVVTGEAVASLLRHAAASGLVFTGQAPLRLYVPGIGEGVHAAVYAEALHRVTGRDLEITSDEPSAQMAGAARERLSALPFVRQVEITVGDAFAADAVRARGLHFAELSNMLYYAPDPAAVARMVGKIADHLAADGLACFAHNAPGSNIQELMTRYSPLALSDATPVVAQAAAALGLPLFTFSIRSDLALRDAALLAALRHRAPDRPELAQAAGVVECLCQRSLGELARAGLLERALDDLGARLDDRAVMEIHVLAQVLPSRALAADAEACARLEQSVARSAADAAQSRARHPVV